jgi:hypothetical protein
MMSSLCVPNNDGLCAVCGRPLSAKYPDAKRVCRLPPNEPQRGPGTELKGIFRRLGFSAKSGCGCEKLRLEMDRLGVTGCRQNFDLLVGKLRKKYHQTTKGERARAAAAALFTGLAFHLDWADPIPSLLRLAIDRAATAES